jgi:hypothetical protein
MNLFLMFLSFYAENRRYYFTGTPAGVAVKPDDILEGF